MVATAVDTKLSAILSSAVAAISCVRVFADRDWEYEYFSPGCKVVFGYSPEELMGNKMLWRSRIPIEDLEAIIQPGFEDIVAERHATHEFRFLHRDGFLRWILESLISRWDQAEQCWIVTIVAIDITDLKRAEEALRQREQEFRALVENAPDVIMRLDRNLRFIYVNPEAEQQMGIPPAAFIGKAAEELGFPDSLVALWHSAIEQVFNTGQEQTLEYEFPRIEGQVCADSRIVPEFDSEGTVESVLVISRDVSKLKQAEEALRQQAQREQSLNRVVQAIRNSLNLNTIFSTAATEITRLLKADQAVIIQYLPQEKIWQCVADYRQSPNLPSALNIEIPDNDNPFATSLKQFGVVKISDYAACKDQISRSLAAIYPGAWLFVPLQIGSEIWGCLSLHHSHQGWDWQDSEVDLACGVADQLAIAIQQSELYEQVQQLNAHLELQVRERTAQLRQAYEFEATLKRITDKVRDSLDEDQILQTAVEELGRAIGLHGCNAALYDLETKTSQIKYEFTTLPTPFRGYTMRMSNFQQGYNQLMAGQHFSFCGLVPYPNRVRVALLACPIQDDQGVLGDLWLVNHTAYQFTEQDIRLAQQVANQCAIAIRQARLYQAAQAQVAELERLNRLKDDFLSTVSHELRTPMSNIKMATQLLELLLFAEKNAHSPESPCASASSTPLVLQPSAFEKARQYFQILKDEGQREISLINDLLDLSRLDAGNNVLHLSTVEPQSWIAQVVAPFWERARGQQQQLRIDIPNTLFPLTTDTTCLERIITELLNNACKYTPAGEWITVSARVVEGVGVKAQPGHSINGQTNELHQPLLGCGFQLSISNSGVELPKSECDRIFEKFYRIPNNDPWKHGGTGLGLALVKKLTERLGGTIRVESAQGQITFTLLLPLTLTAEPVV